MGAIQILRRFSISGDGLNVTLDIGSDSAGQAWAVAETPPDSEGFTFTMKGPARIIADSEQLPEAGYFSLSDGERRIEVLWQEAIVSKEGNPATYRYRLDPKAKHGYRLFTDGEESASEAQIAEIRKARRKLIRLVRFEQAQGGGRKKGSRASKTKQEYHRILAMRSSRAWLSKTDKEFVTRYPEWRHKLARAKRWDAEGRP